MQAGDGVEGLSVPWPSTALLLLKVLGEVVKETDCLFLTVLGVVAEGDVVIEGP